MVRVLCRLLIIVVICYALPATALSSTQARGLPPSSMLEIEKLLSGLGYWITKVDGKPDASTQHAIMAFQKVEGRKRTGKMSPADIEALRAAKTPEPRYPEDHTAHIEVDLTRQVLFYVDESGAVTRILPISSGNEKKFFDQGQWKVAHTPTGKYVFGSKINGVKKSTLGLLYYPSYFAGGLAIHGSNSIPAFPASHGCVRVPRFADQALFKMIKLWMGVYLYK